MVHRSAKYAVKNGIRGESRRGARKARTSDALNFCLLTFAFCFLTCPSLFAQSNYAITAGWVCGADAAGDSRINGWVLDLRVYNLSTGGTYSLGIDTAYPANSPYNKPYKPNLALSVLSSGYTNAGSSTTWTRTLYGTLPVRQPYPNQTSNDEFAAGSADACSGDTVPTSYVDIRIALSDFVYSTDTSLSLTASAGIYTQGGHGTLAANALSITNNSSTSINACANSAAGSNSGVTYPANCSAAVAPMPVCRWATVPLQMVTAATFPVEVVCFDRHYRQGLPVAAVVVSAQDQHSNSVSYTITKPTISTTNPGDQGKVQAYVANVSFTSLNAADNVTLNFTAYPWIGSSLSTSTTTGPIIVAALNAGGSGYAVGDTGTITGSGCSVPAMYKVLTLSTTAVATFAITYGGYGCSTASAATTTTGGYQAGSGSGFKVNSTVYRGTANLEDLGPITLLNCYNTSAGYCAQPAAVVDPANGQSSSASTWVYANVSTAESAYNGTNTDSYKNQAYALAACKAYNNSNNGHADPGGCHIRMISAQHTLSSNGSDLGTQRSWAIVEPFTSASPTIIAGVNSSAHTEAVEYQNLAVCDTISVGCGNTTATCSGSGCYIFVGTSATDRIWLNNINPFYHASGDIFNWNAGYATNNTFTAINTGGLSHFSTYRSPWPLIRGNVFPSGTRNATCSLYAVLANKNCYAANYEQSQSTSGAANPNSQALSDGFIYAFNQIYGVTASYWNTANAGLWQSTLSVMNYGAAEVENVFEQTNSAGPLQGFANDNDNCSTKNVMMWNNTIIGERANDFYNDGSDAGDSTFVNWYAHNQESIIGNIFASMNTKTDTFSSHYNGARTGNWSVHYHVGSAGNRILQCVGVPACVEGPTSWMGSFSGLYSDYNPSQVSGTDSNSYIVKLLNTGAAANKPITGGSYATYWTNVGNTAGDSLSNWTSGYIYEPMNFIHDYSYSTGTAAGNGNYRPLGSSSAINLFNCQYEPLPYDLDGKPRWGGSGCSAGAYENDPVLTPVFW